MLKKYRLEILISWKLNEGSTKILKICFLFYLFTSMKNCFLDPDLYDPLLFGPLVTD
jgi:hypothetical protein